MTEGEGVSYNGRVCSQDALVRRWVGRAGAAGKLIEREVAG